MKALFIHGHKFRKINNAFYSTGGLSNEVLTRYVDYYGDLTVVARVINELEVKNNYNPITNSRITIKTKECLKQEIENSDIVIIRLPNKYGYKAASLCRKLNKPYLIEVVACVWDSYWYHGLTGKICAPYMFIRMRKAVKTAPKVLYVTKGFLQTRYPTNGEWVSISDVELPKNDQSVLEKRLNKIDNRTDVIVLGTAGPVDVKYKGQEFVIRSLSALSDKGYKIEYRLAGIGNPERLKAIAKECGVEKMIRFEGSIPHDKIFAWLDDLDLYIHPSMAEGMPRILLEAMSRGLPCIVTKKGGMPDIIEDKWVIKCDKKAMPIDITERIELILNEDKAHEMAIRNYMYVKEYFDSKKLDEERRNFYKSALIESKMHKNTGGGYNQPIILIFDYDEIAPSEDWRCAA